MKRLWFAAVCLMAAVTLSGCHGGRSTAAFDVPESFDTSKEYEITFWAKNDTNKVQTAIYNEAIAGFEKLYPNVKVNMRLYTDYGRIYNDVITNISTNTTPNVCITYPDHIATYMTGSNVVVPLDSLFDDAKYGLGGSEVLFDGPKRDEIVPQFLDECLIKDTHYAIPFMRSTEACYINQTYVEALGYTVPETVTWDWMFEVAEAAMAQNPDGTFKINGQNVMIPIIYKSTDNMMIQMLRQKNYPYSDENGNILIFSDETKEILEMIMPHAKSLAFSTFKISSYPANFLNAGQCIFAIDSTAGATWMGSHAPLIDIAESALVEFETAVRTVPQFDPQNPQMISQGPSICVFNKEDSQEVLASWLFAQYLITNDVQIAYAETEGYVPVTLKAQESPEYQAYLDAEGSDGTDHYDIKIKASRLLLENTGNTFVTPVFNGSASLRDAAGQLIENTTKAMRWGRETDENYLDGVFEAVASLYHLDQGTSAGSGSKDLGPLPAESKFLLSALAVLWVLIAIYYVWTQRRRES